MEQGITHGISEGVSGLEPGGGRLIKVGGCVCAMVAVDWLYMTRKDRGSGCSEASTDDSGKCKRKR
jgi:hypothetical protein